MKRVLVVVPNLRICNGVASYIMNYFRCIDHSCIQMDFVVLKDIASPYYAEIQENGGNIFTMPSPKQLVPYCRRIRSLYAEGHYDVLHCNVTNAGIPYLYYAKKMDIPKRILHCHATRSAEVKWKEIRNDMLTPLALKNANIFFACSHMAGDSLFGKRPYTVIHNALDLSVFRYQPHIRDMMRRELNLEGKFVIGTVGRLAHQKNRYFALDVFREVLKRQKNAVYLWIGSGPLDAQVRQYAEELHLGEHMRFLGNREDVDQLYQVMDVFFLPSLYEGLPVVGIEAQACGLPVVVSDTVTKEMKVTDGVTFLSLQSEKKEWAQSLLHLYKYERADTANYIQKSGYEIHAEAKKLQNLYFTLS